ncbi:MAG: zinc ribbon domain-containing protein [Eubacteriaceae bacterium]
MTFAEVELEYERLRISYINEVIDYEEFMDYIEEVLQVTDEDGVLWRKDINGNWLYFSTESNEWLISERMNEINEEDYIVSFEAPKAPDISKDNIEEKKPNPLKKKPGMMDSQKNEEEMEHTKSHIRYCTGCGEQIKENEKFCTNCGKKK